MKEEIHVMLDLETLGNRINPVLVQISAVTFSFEEDVVPKEFDVLINNVVKRLLMKGQVFFQPGPNFVEELESQLASSVNFARPQTFVLVLAGTRD